MLYYFYIIIQVIIEGKEISVCKVALAHLHGVTKSRIERIIIASAYKCQVSAPIDGRGRHKNRPHAITDTILHQIDKDICSILQGNHHKVYFSPDLSHSQDA